VISLPRSIDALLDEVARRLTVRADRQQQLRRLAEHVEDARRRYGALDPARRQELRRSARRLIALRQRVALLTGSPACCSDCAQRMARSARQPAPLLPGGHCCGGDPERIFDELEVAGLWLAGRRPSRWSMVPRRTGCYFRGREGCQLRPIDRPSICARYLCSELTAALSRSGALPDVLESSDALEVEMARIAELLGITPAPI